MEFLSKMTKNKERKKLFWLADRWLGNPV